MKKHKLLKLIVLTPFIGTLAIPLISCGDTNYIITLDTSTLVGGTISGPATLEVKSGTKWSTISGKYQATPNDGYGCTGWYANGTKLTDNYQFTKAVTITARFETCVLTFTPGAIEGGAVAGPATFNVAPDTTWAVAKAKANYTHSDDTDEYAWVGWYANGVKLEDNTKITSNVTITGKFSTCILTCNSQTVEGGTYSGPASKKVKPGTKWTNIKSLYTTPSIDDKYILKGWYVNGELLTDDYTFNDNATITAKFYTCNIKYVAGGGGSISGTTTLKIKPGTKWSEVTDRPTCTPSTGCSFDNWYGNNNELTNDTVIDDSMNISAEFKLNALPTVNTLSKVNADAFLYNSKTGKYENYTDKGYFDSYPIYQINGMSQGYMLLEYYLGRYSSNFKVNTNTTTHQTTIINLLNSSTCVVDYLRQTITFDDYETFIDYYNEPAKPLMGGGGGEAYYKTYKSTIYNKANPKRLDLKKYNIIAFEEQGYGLLPYEVINNVFSLDISGYWIPLDFNGTGLYEVVEGYYDEGTSSKALVKSAAQQGFYTSEYMEYCYNLLALTLDFRFGLRERESRANEGTTIQYLPDGALIMLSKYHDSLVSTKDDVSAQAMRDVFRYELDDGGHTVYVNQNVFSTSDVSWTKVFGSEFLHTDDIYTNLYYARQSAGVKEGYKEYTKSGKDTIAYITFDSFESEEDEDNWTSAEKSAGRELPSGTNDNNYMNDTLRLTMYANKKIKQNNIKNVVIDLSCNGGGVVYTEHFIASWLCGGVTEKIYNPTTNSYCEYRVEADIDGDGKFDDNDKLASDVQLYVITSSSSFSCGNMLPTNIQDYRPTNTTFIGTKSGGGACFVDGNILLGLGTMVQFSSTNHMLRGSSSYGNFITNDDGNTITSGWEINDSTNPSGFFDRAAINNKIWNK